VTETALATVGRDPELDRLARLGRWLAASETGSDSQVAREMAAALRLYYVHELGLPLQAAAEVSVIKGRLFVGAKLLRALASRQGYRVIRMDGSNEYSCTAVLVRADTGERMGESTFTIEDAKRAGLIRGGSAWQSHPARMLWARASKFVLDDYAPEVTLGLGSDDEIPEYTGAAQPDPGPQPAGTAAPVPEPEPEEGEWWEPDPDPDDDVEPAAGLPAAPAGVGPPASAGQLRKLRATYREHGLEDREQQLGFASAVLDRNVETHTSLTTPLEEPDPEPEVSSAQRAALYALLEQRHLDGMQRLDLLAELVGHPVNAVDHLTPEEADLVIDRLSGRTEQ